MPKALQHKYAKVNFFLNQFSTENKPTLDQIWLIAGNSLFLTTVIKGGRILENVNY